MGNIAMACFDEAYYNGLSDEDKARLLKIVKSGLENPDSEMGCYAMNPTDYDEFYPVFKNALSKYHKVNLDETKHVNCWDLKTCEGLPADGSLDVSKFGLSALSMRIRTARNLKKFPLAGAMTQQDRCDMENAMQPVFEELIKNPDFGGEYVSLTPGHKCHISDERYNELVKAHIMFKDMSADSFLMDAGIACHWPHGRGCYYSSDKGFIIWVGEEDHLRIMAMKKSTKINDVFDRLKAAIDVVEKLIPGGCAKSNDLVSSPPAQPTWVLVCALPFTSLSRTSPKTVPTLKLKKSANHSASVFAVWVVSTLQLVLMVPLIFRQRDASVSLKLKLLLRYTRVLRRSGLKNKRHRR